MNIGRFLRSILPSADKYIEGAEVLVDGGLETWASATDLTYWAEDIPGSSTINREATEKHGGTYAVRANVVGGDHAGFYQSGKIITPGKRMRVSFWYKTPASGTPWLWIYAGVSFDYSLMLGANGPYWSAGSGHYIILPTATTWTRYVLEVDALDNYNSYLFSLSGDGVDGDYYFDDFSVKELTPAGIVSCLVPGPGTKGYDIIHDKTIDATTGIIPKVGGDPMPILTDIGWKFNGTSDHMGPVVASPSDAISLGFWLQRTGNKVAQPVVSLANGITNTPSFLIDGGSAPYYNQPVAWLGDGNWQYWSASTPVDMSKMGHWYFYVFTVPGSALNDLDNCVCYINGIVQEKTISSKTSEQSARSTVRVGRSGGEYLACPIAMPFVANRVLTQQEVQNIYNATKGMFFPRG